MARLYWDKRIAEQNGETVPSLVEDAIYTHDDGSEWRGRYEGRYTFKPFGEGPYGNGEAFCVNPEQVRRA